MTQHIGCKPGWTWKIDQPLEVIECGSCHVMFAIPEGMADKVRATGASFYCPNGNRISYSETEEQRLRRRLNAERAHAGRLAHERDQAEASARAQKAAKTRIKNQRDRERARTVVGVCPCCNRTFKQLARHMANQHPDWPRDAEEVLP